MYTSGIAITAITYKEPRLHFENSQIKSFYDGLINKEGSEFKGTWKRGSAGWLSSSPEHSRTPSLRRESRLTDSVLRQRSPIESSMMVSI